MVNKLEVFPGDRRPHMNWRRYADAQIYLFTPADGLYADATQFRTAARMWARRHGYAMTSSLIASDVEGEQPSVAIRFMKI